MGHMSNAINLGHMRESKPGHEPTRWPTAGTGPCCLVGPVPQLGLGSSWPPVPLLELTWNLQNPPPNVLPTTIMIFLPLETNCSYESYILALYLCLKFWNANLSNNIYVLKATPNNKFFVSGYTYIWIYNFGTYSSQYLLSCIVPCMIWMVDTCTPGWFANI